MNKKVALALEGGGAKGSYQVGAVKALIELGYSFEAIVGTSIGSINGAMIASGNIDKLEDIWLNSNMGDIIEDGEVMEALLNFKIPSDAVKFFVDSIKSKGIDTTPLRQLLEKNIDEDYLRRQNAVFGLTTVAIRDYKFIPVQVFLDEIPNGELIDYIMASSCIPGFKPVIIDGATMVDGGIFDNLPVNMLLKKGYKDIIAIKLNRIARLQPVKKADQKYIRYIDSKIGLGGILKVDPERAAKNIELGRKDVLEFFSIKR